MDKAELEKQLKEANERLQDAVDQTNPIVLFVIKIFFPKYRGLKRSGKTTANDTQQCPDTE